MEITVIFAVVVLATVIGVKNNNLNLKNSLV